MHSRARLPLLLLAAAAAAMQVSAQDAQSPKLPNFERRTPIVLAVENVGPAVVSISTKSRVARFHPFSGLFQMPEVDHGNGQLAPRSMGSGVIIHPAGYVVTNDHVVSGADQIEVQVMHPDHKLATLGARLINSDTDNDIAVLKIDGPGPFPYAALGDSDQLMVGETTIALGNPFGLVDSVTTGILSARNRSVTMRGKVVFKDFIQTSALINPGNSGGPLLDINGYVIGINVAIDNRGPGIGYAIPINRVRDVATTLLDPEVVRRAWLGAEFVDAGAGVRVEKVADGSPAAKTALATGDQVVAVSGRPIRSRLALNIEMLESAPGRPVTFTVRQSDKVKDVPVELEEVPLAAFSKTTFESVGMSVADLTPALARQFNLDASHAGVVITKVDAKSVAAEVGLAAGDVLFQLGNYSVRDTNDLTAKVRAYARAGRAPDIHVLRNGSVLNGRIPIR